MGRRYAWEAVADIVNNVSWWVTPQRPTLKT
jgi:hypothetical protein